MRYYLGADVGATKTHVLIADDCGQAVGFGQSGPGNHESVGYGGLFGGLYQVLASEDHALLMGAWLTFGVLALTMYLTRKLDWREIGRTPAPAIAQPQ